MRWTDGRPRCGGWVNGFGSVDGAKTTTPAPACYGYGTVSRLAKQRQSWGGWAPCWPWHRLTKGKSWGRHTLTWKTKHSLGRRGVEIQVKAGQGKVGKAKAWHATCCCRGLGQALACVYVCVCVCVCLCLHMEETSVLRWAAWLCLACLATASHDARMHRLHTV
jgi:hypothetical protein